MKIMYIFEITKVKRAKKIVGMKTNCVLNQTEANYINLHWGFLLKNMPCHSANK